MFLEYTKKKLIISIPLIQKEYRFLQSTIFPIQIMISI